MNFLEKLAEIANRLDAKGLHEEANILDGIIKAAQDFPPGWQSVHNFPEDTIVGRKPTIYNFPPDVIRGRPGGRMQRYVAGLDKLRKMLGLGPGDFDIELARKLNALNRKYPGVWVPGTGQKLSQIMANAERALAKEFEYAQKTKKSPQIGGQAPNTLPSGSRDPGQVTSRPSDEQLFPPTANPPVTLSEKEEFRL